MLPNTSAELRSPDVLNVAAGFALQQDHAASRTMATDRGIRLIAYLKVFNGALLILSGIGLLSILHKDVAEVLMQWINALHINPGNRYVQNLLLKASTVSDSQLKTLSLGSFFYAGLVFTESTALLLQKWWAQHFTVIVTASFLPFEVWGLLKRFSGVRTFVIAVNIAIVWYLIARIRNAESRQEMRSRKLSLMS